MKTTNPARSEKVFKNFQIPFVGQERQQTSLNQKPYRISSEHQRKNFTPHGTLDDDCSSNQSIEEEIDKAFSKKSRRQKWK